MISASAAIALSCQADIPMPDSQRDALCRALHAALVDKAGADRVHPLADGGTAAAGALRIALHLTRADARTVEGHLEWQRDDGQPVTGPPVIVSVDDAPLGAWMYPSFAAGLLQVSKLPL